MHGCAHTSLYPILPTEEIPSIPGTTPPIQTPPSTIDTFLTIIENGTTFDQEGFYNPILDLLTIKVPPHNTYGQTECLLFLNLETPGFLKRHKTLGEGGGRVLTHTPPILKTALRAVFGQFFIPPSKYI